jgi:glycosyltransferase involved in cell wall biosynthesis
MAINFTKPIVSTDVGGLKEVVSDKIGYISKRNNKDLSNKIMDAIENINSNKFEINLKYLKEKNSWENFYKMFVESIKNI